MGPYEGHVRDALKRISTAAVGVLAATANVSFGLAVEVRQEARGETDGRAKAALYGVAVNAAATAGAHAARLVGLVVPRSLSVKGRMEVSRTIRWTSLTPEQRAALAPVLNMGREQLGLTEGDDVVNGEVVDP